MRRRDGGRPRAARASSGLRPAGGGLVGSVRVDCARPPRGSTRQAGGRASSIGGVTLLDGRVSIGSAVRMPARAGLGRPRGAHRGRGHGRHGRRRSRSPPGPGAASRCPGIGTIVFMEQVSDGAGGVRANALRVEVTDPHGGDGRSASPSSSATSTSRPPPARRRPRPSRPRAARRGPAAPPRAARDGPAPDRARGRPGGADRRPPPRSGCRAGGRAAGDDRRPTRGYVFPVVGRRQLHRRLRRAPGRHRLAPRQRPLRRPRDAGRGGRRRHALEGRRQHPRRQPPLAHRRRRQRLLLRPPVGLRARRRRGRPRDARAR